AGVVRTVFDASEDEVRALALGADGALYAAALSTSAVSEEDHDSDTPMPAKSAVAGGRAVLYRVIPDSSSATWWTSPQPFLFALATLRGKLLAASGNRAGVFEIERSGGAT